MGGKKNLLATYTIEGRNIIRSYKGSKLNQLENDSKSEVASMLPLKLQSKYLLQLHEEPKKHHNASHSSLGSNSL